MSDLSEHLPAGWITATLEQIAEPTKGAITDGPFGSNLKTEHYTASGPLVIRLQNIGEGAFKRDDAHIAREHFDRLTKHHVREGDLVVAMLGERLPRSCLIPPDIEPALVKADCARVRLNAAVADGRYINWWLNSSEVQRTVTAIVKGVGRPRINLGQLRQVRVDLPPISEQRRIVAKIEELLSDLNAGFVALERAKAKLKRYRASVLNAAVTGMLTEEWRKENPPAEPAAKLLARILDERRKKWEEEQLRKFAESGKSPPNGWKQKYVAAVQPDDNLRVHLSDGWIVASVEQLTTLITSGSRDWSQYYGRGTGTFIMAQNVRPAKLDLAHRVAVDPPADNRDRLRSQVLSDDLLITIVGANTGDVCRVPQALPEHYVCQSVSLMRPVIPVFSRYIELYLSSPENGQKQFGQYIYGAGRPHLSFDQIKMTAIPVPPVAEQRTIVAEMDRRLSVVDAVEAEIEHSLKRAARLRQAILKRAFEGTLVPQDPADAPASTLLDRLRTAPEQPPTTTARARTSGRRPQSRSTEGVATRE